MCIFHGALLQDVLKKVAIVVVRTNVIAKNRIVVIEGCANSLLISHYPL